MSKPLSVRYKSLATIIVILVWAYSGPAFSQSELPPGATDAGSKSTQKDLDRQWLQGLGGTPSQPTQSQPAASQPTASQPSGEEARVSAAVESGQGRDSAERNLESVLDPSVEGSDLGQQNPLIRIGRQMRQVEQLLIQRNVAVETQQTQHQIVEQLDELIEALAASQQAQKQQKTPASSPDDQQASKTGREATRNGSGEPEGTGADGQSSASLQGAVGGFWGHLPDRLRRQMSSAEAIEFLPKYRKLIEDYYRRLAEDRGIQ